MALKADRLVVGHTPQQRVNSALEQKVWRVDVGASLGVLNGTPEVLQVLMDKTGREKVSVLTEEGNVNEKGRWTPGVAERYFTW